MEQTHAQQSNNNPPNTDSISGLFSGISDSWNANHEIENIILNQNHKFSFFDMRTGGGKSAQAIELITNILGNSFVNKQPTEYNIKFIYSTSRVLEILEGLIRLRHKLIEEKGSKHYTKFLDKAFIRFRKDSDSYVKAIETLTTGVNNKTSPFTAKDLKWVKEFVEGDITAKLSKASIAKIFSARVIITTHASLPIIGQILGSKCEEYACFVDEVPYEFFSMSDVIDNDTFKSDINHLMNSNTRVEEISRASALAKQFKIGLLTYTEINGTRVIHYNKNHPFKSLLVSSASTGKAVLLNEIYGDYINIIESTMNGSLITIGKDNLEVVYEAFDKPEEVLNVCTASSSGNNINEILSDMTGSNSYSGFTKVELHGNFCFPESVKNQLSNLFGDNAEIIETILFRDRLLQSVYRSAIRKGEKIQVRVSNRRQAELVASLFI